MVKAVIGPNETTVVVLPRSPVSTALRGFLYPLTAVGGCYRVASMGGLASPGTYSKRGRGLAKLAASIAFFICSDTCYIMASVMVDMKFLRVSTVT